MSRILIIGATSAIAEAAARCFAMRSAHLSLVARDKVRLDSIAADLSVRGAASVSTHILDVNDYESHQHVLSETPLETGEIDVVLIAHGTLPEQASCEADPQVSIREFSTNATSTIALCTRIAPQLRRGATLAVISSVAGDRGRASNYLYGSAKAAVSTFLSGLRQSLHRQGINVLTIKPGFVDTPMTANFRKGMLWAKPETIASGIVKAIDSRKSVAYLPGFWFVIMRVITHIPEWLFKRVAL